MAEENDNLRILPVWKKGATAEDWFHDMAVIARKFPKRFNRMVLVYQEDLPDDRARNAYYCHNVDTTEAVGLIELGKAELIIYTKGILQK
jgi:hypothetical protein